MLNALRSSCALLSSTCPTRSRRPTLALAFSPLSAAALPELFPTPLLLVVLLLVLLFRPPPLLVVLPLVLPILPLLPLLAVLLPLLLPPLAGASCSIGKALSGLFLSPAFNTEKMAWLTMVELVEMVGKAPMTHRVMPTATGQDRALPERAGAWAAAHLQGACVSGPIGKSACGLRPRQPAGSPVAPVNAHGHPGPPVAPSATGRLAACRTHPV